MDETLGAIGEQLRPGTVVVDVSFRTARPNARRC